MTSNFDAHKDSGQQNIREMDSLQRARFELLSAYLDGEMKAAERKQVQEWLATDPEVKRQYAKLLKLRQGMQTLPLPPAQQPSQQLVQQVFARLDRHQFRQIITWGGGAIAALFIGAFSGILPGSQSPAPQLAQVPQPEVNSEPLMVALNEPVIRIPKAALADPDKLVKPLSESGNIEKNQ